MNQDEKRILNLTETRLHLITWQRETEKKLQEFYSTSIIHVDSLEQFRHDNMIGPIVEISFSYSIKGELLFKFIFFYNIKFEIFQYDLDFSNFTNYNEFRKYAKTLFDAFQMFECEVENFKNIPQYRLQFLMNPQQIIPCKNVLRFKEKFFQTNMDTQ